MKLEVGKSYETANGFIIHIIDSREHLDEDDQPCNLYYMSPSEHLRNLLGRSFDSLAYQENGRVYTWIDPKHENDLKIVSEIPRILLSKDNRKNFVPISEMNSRIADYKEIPQPFTIDSAGKFSFDPGFIKELQTALWQLEQSRK